MLEAMIFAVSDMCMNFLIIWQCLHEDLARRLQALLLGASDAMMG